MSYHCKEKIWLNDISCLCNDYRLLPLDDMSNEQKFNSITRALIFAIIVLYLLEYKDANKVAMLSIFLLLTIYFMQKNNESYNKMKTIQGNSKNTIIDGLPSQCEIEQPQRQIEQPQRQIEQPQRQIEQPQRQIEQPQRQIERVKGNSKVLEQPPVVPGLYDDVWNDDVNTKYSVVNQPSINYDNISGNISTKDDIIESFISSDRLELPKRNHEPSYEVNNTSKPKKTVRFNLEDTSNNNKCGKSFTTNIGSELTMNEEMIEPIDFNLSINQPFDETHKTTVFDKDKQKYIVIYHKDEAKQKIDVFAKDCKKQVNIDDIYDPRLSGSGSNERYYFDKNSDTIRYFYDDVNSIRKPNYLIRSHIDTVDFADSTGPYKEGSGLLNRDDSRSFRDNINQKFQNDNIEFRTDMMTNILRKLNRKMIHDDTDYKHTNNMNRYTI